MHRSKQAIFIAFLAAVFLIPGLASAAVDAESVVSGKCTACHSAERIRESQKTKSEWKSLVDDEIDRGAQLTRAERTAVVDWLADNYGVGEAEEVAEAEESEPEEEVETAAPASEATTDVVTEEVAAEEALPFDTQAETGVELWQFLLMGGSLMAGGAWMRRR